MLCLGDCPKTFTSLTRNTLLKSDNALPNNNYIKGKCMCGNVQIFDTAYILRRRIELQICDAPKIKCEVL